MLSIGIGLTSVPVLARRGSYDPDALAFFARLTNQPTDARKKLYSDLIVSLKAAGIWAKLDALYILAAADAQAARQNLVANAYNLTAVGSPVFTADRGYTGDGVGAYLETGFNPTSAVSPKYTQDNAAMGIWSRTNLLNAGAVTAEIGSANSRLGRATNPGLAFGRTNSGVTVNSIAPNGYPGHSAFVRDGSTNWVGYAQGASAATGTDASAALSNATFSLLRATGGAYSVNQLAAAYFGAKLSGGEMSTLHSALNTYLTAVGAN